MDHWPIKARALLLLCYNLIAIREEGDRRKFSLAFVYFAQFYIPEEYEELQCTLGLNQVFWLRFPLSDVS